MKFFVLTVCLCVTVFVFIATAPQSCTNEQIQWNNIYSASWGNDQGFDVLVLHDGSYAVVGTVDWVQTEPYYDMKSGAILFHLDLDGNVIFGNGYFDSPNNCKLCRKEFWTVQEYPGGFIVGGREQIYPDGNDTFTLKALDENGEEIWNRYGGLQGEVIFGSVFSSSGNMIATGRRSYYPSDGVAPDMLFAGFTQEGENTDSSSIGIGGGEEGRAVIETPEGSFVIAGSIISSDGEKKALIVKTDTKGVLQNSIVFPDEKGAEAETYDIVQTADNGFVATGWVQWEGHQDKDLLVFKFFLYGKDLGEIVWVQTLNEAVCDDEGRSISLSASSDIVVTGSTESFGAGQSDLLFMMLDQGGNIMEYKTYGGTGDDRGYSITMAADKGFILTGTSTSYTNGAYDLWVIKTDAYGSAPSEPQVLINE